MRETAQVSDKAKGRRTLLLIFVLFALPVLLVLGMRHIGWHPGGGSYGELITPPLALRLTDLHDMQGEIFPTGRWHGKWHLVYIAAGDCTSRCSTQLRQLRQVHVSLNKEIPRLERILLSPAQQDGAALAQQQSMYPDLVILDGAQAARLASQFPGSTEGRVYLVDPLGNLIMRYPADYDPAGLRRDLLQLLRYSWVG